MFSEKVFAKCWMCPSDRVLILRARLSCGWSTHTDNIFRQIETISSSELQAIEEVLRRANQVEKLEVERVGRMLCKLENMGTNTLGDGKKTCSMCGVAFGFFGSSLRCVDCEKAVCEKCKVETLTSTPEFCVLCKICSENREVWKMSGGWFYGRFPTMSEDFQKDCISQITGSPSLMRAYDTWEHRAPDIVRFESFEPAEENRNDNFLYKDWTMNSTPDLNSAENDDSQSNELESFRKRYHEQNQLTVMNYLRVESGHLSASCPALTELTEPPKLTRKASVRRKHKSGLSAKIRKISTRKERP